MASTSNIDASIIIVNYNTAEELRGCILSVQKHTIGINYEIIVVDNNSVDNSKTMLNEEFPSLECHFLERNTGFSFANNFGMERCHGKYIFLLNPDTTFKDNSLLKMHDFFENNSNVGAAGPVITDNNGKFRLTIRNFPNMKLHFADALNIKSLIKRYSLSKEQYESIEKEEPFEVDWISGGSFMLRRTIFDDIGGLDERFYLFGEDVDWCFRIKENGWKIYCLPQVKIVHIGGVSTHKNYFVLVSNRYRSKLILTRKYVNKTQLFIIRILVLLGLLLRLFSSLFRRYSEPKEKHERIRAYFASFFLWLGIKKIYSAEQVEN